MATKETKTKEKTKAPAQPELQTEAEAKKGKLIVPEQKTKLSDILEARGIEPHLWRALNASIFPGANPTSVLLVIDYCRSRNLDPMKRPCHIVPMKVKNQQTGEYQWRDIIMPGISELRTTASRSKEYLGHSKPKLAGEIDFQGLKVPEKCEVIIYRRGPDGSKISYPWEEFFVELVCTKSDGNINSMWKKRPRGQLVKCTIAGALRDAFPEEAGGMVTAEEMEGRVITTSGIEEISEIVEVTAAAAPESVDAALDTAVDKPADIADSAEKNDTKLGGPHGPNDDCAFEIKPVKTASDAAKVGSEDPKTKEWIDENAKSASKDTSEEVQDWLDEHAEAGGDRPK